MRLYINKLKSLLISKRDIVGNALYVSILQVFVVAAPLITYPYLVRVLGTELYGIVLSAQMLASYASLIIDFGSNSVCAKHVSINRDNSGKLSEILSSILLTRTILFVLIFFVYMLVVYLIPVYREYIYLFIITYFITLNDVLFPQFFFQGIEKMKYVTIINIGVKLFFILLIFILVKSVDDILLIPLLYSVGYMLGGISSLLIVRFKLGIGFKIPTYHQAIIYVKDSSAIFATELICTVKDKLNYLFVGTLVNMNSVVLYDLAIKLNSFLTKPLNVISIVLFPRFAKNRNLKKLKMVIVGSFILTLFLVVLVNIFLPQITKLFINETSDLLPIRLFLLAPLMLSISSMLSTNLFIAFGYNKYVLYSIIITTIVYIISLCYILLGGYQSNLYSFIILALVSYLTEFVYRLFVACKIYSLSK
ncbi:oligosaccharide flippase family protein [Parabacteroides pacaensis]|uniref:oligosaccharide flippase family protein n=1 Tax=Parabacteroides pacaensis TaxID=2086575 RepID=UPI000D0FF14D|nr:oligosaccharide flippase family protein [Parabacteroides pacaensis]